MTTRDFASVSRVMGWALVLSVWSAGGVSQAASGTWSKTSGGPYNWLDSANWASGNVPNGAGQTASVTANLTAIQTINLNAAITNSVLTIGDSGSTYSGYTIAAGTSGTLIFDNSGGAVSISKPTSQAADLISAPITLAGNATFNNGQSNSGRTLTLSGGIGEDSFARSVTITGGGVSALVVYTGASTYSGGTTISSGCLRLNNASALPSSGALTLSGTGILELQNPLSITRSLGSGSGNIQITGGVAGFSAISATATVNINNDNSTLQWGSASFNPTELVLNGTQASSTLNFQNGIDLNGTTRTINTVASAQTANMSAGIINGGGGTPGLIKKGSGTLNLTGSSSYSGPTTVQAGTLRFNSIANADGTASALGAPVGEPDGTIKVGALTTAGIVRYDGASQSTDRVFDLAGTTAGITFQSYSTGPLVLTAGFSASGSGAKTLTLGGTSVATNEVQGAIVDSAGGATALTKTDAGLWLLSGTRSYTGKTTVGGGTLRFDSIANADGTASALGAPTNTTDGVIGIGSGTGSATLGYVGPGHTTDRVINLAGTTGGATLEALGTGPLIFTSAFTATGGGIKTLTLGGTSLLDNELRGDVIDNSALNVTKLAKSGTGRWILTGNRSYTGATSISGGTLVIDAIANADGTASPIGAPTTLTNGIIGLSGTLRYTGSGHTTDRVLNLYGSSLSGTLDASGTGPLVFTSDTTTTGTGDKKLYLTGDNTDANTILGSIVNKSSTDTTGLVKSGAGTWVLGGNNTFTDPVTINAGVLRMANAGALNAAAPVTVSFAADAPEGTKLQLNGYGVTAKNLASGSPLGNPVVENGHATNAGTLTLLQTATSTFAGVMQDGGAAALNLGKTGAGQTLILTGDNTYSGTSTITAGTLQLGNAGTSGTVGTGAVVNNGTLTVNRTDTYAMDNAISGTGALIKNGVGVWVLNGDNSYDGLTTVSVGTLRARHAHALGSALGGTTVSSGATLSLDDGIEVLGEALSLTGTGYTGLGALHSLSGTNRYAGPITFVGNTTIGADAGRLRIASASRDASSRAVTLAGAGDGIFEGPLLLGTSGDLTLSGTGTWVLADDSIMDNITVNSGILQIGNGAASGTVGDNSIYVYAPGLLRFARADDYTVGVTITGSGTVENAGPGRLILTIDNTYTGPTVIGAGSAGVDIGSGGTTGAVGFGTITNNAVLHSNRSNSSTIGGPIVGTGSFVKSGGSTTTFTNDNSYAGTTTINAGTLQIGNGGTTGSLGLGDVIDNGTLTFNHSDDLVITHNISGSGGITKLGSGTVTLPNALPYGGITTVTTGTLRILDAGALGTTDNHSIVNGGVLEFPELGTLDEPFRVGAGTLQSTAGDNTISGTVGMYGNGTISVTAGKLVLANAASIARDGTNNRNLTLAGAGEGDVQGTLTLGTSTTTLSHLNKTGTGLWTLRGIGTLTGLTSIFDGTLRVTDPRALGLSTLVHTNTYAGVLDVTSLTNLVVGGLTGDKTFVLENPLGEPLELTIGGTNNAASRYFGVLTGKGSLVKAGTGDFIIDSGDCTYEGPTTLLAGRLFIGYNSTTGSLGTNDVTALGGRLEYRRLDDCVVSNNIVGACGLSNTGTNVLTMAGHIDISGTTTIQANTQYGNAGHPVIQFGDGTSHGGVSNRVGAIAMSLVDTEYGHVVFNFPDDTYVTGSITGLGTVRNVGTGRVLLVAGSNGWTGETWVDQGTLVIANGTGSGWLGTNVVHNNGVVEYSRNSPNNPNVVNVFTGTGRLIQNGTNSPIALASASDYTGGTIVSNGTLLAINSEGSATGPGLVEVVGAASTLGGTGTVAAVSVGLGGSLSGGVGGAGTLTTGPVTMDAQAHLAVELAAPGTSGLVNVIGDATVAGTVNVLSVAPSLYIDGSYTLLKCTGTLTNNGLTIGTLPPEFVGSLVVDTVHREVRLETKAPGTVITLF